MYRVAIGNPTAQTGRRIAGSRRGAYRTKPVHIRLTLLLLMTFLALPLAAEAKLRTPGAEAGLAVGALVTTQRNGMSLNEAVESVRRRSDVERVLSAETRVEGGREVHHIKVMTKNGTVRTIRVNGRSR